MINRQTDRLVDRMMNRQPDRQVDRLINRQTDRQVDRVMNRQTDRQVDRMMNRQADRQVSRPTDHIQTTDRQETDEHTNYIRTSGPMEGNTNTHHTWTHNRFLP